MLATDVPAFERRVRSAMHGQLEGALQVLPRGPLPVDPAALLAQVADGATPEVIVLGAGMPVVDAIQLAASLDRQCPTISVVLVTEPTQALWLEAMRAGVRDVLVPEADSTEIRTVLDRAILAAEVRRKAIGAGDDASPAGRVITVASAKGGTGKTTVATNLAVGLARLNPHTTVVVDLDVQFGDVATALQLIPDYSLVDAVSGPSSHDAMVLKTFLQLHSTGLYALCGPDTPGAADQVTGEQVTRLLDLLAASFEHVVVDTAPGLGEHALAALERATDIVQVCRLDVPSVRALRKELDVLAQLDIAPLTQTIVLNFADQAGGLSVKDVEATIGAPVDVVLPPSRTVLVSTNHGVPLLQSDGRNPVSKELHKLISRYVDASIGSGRGRPGVPAAVADTEEARRPTALRPQRRWTRRAAAPG